MAKYRCECCVYPDGSISCLTEHDIEMDSRRDEDWWEERKLENEGKRSAQGGVWVFVEVEVDDAADAS